MCAALCPQMEQGSFQQNYYIKTSVLHQNCIECGRRNNFLDLVATGLHVHSAEFMRDVFSGKYGNILNSNPHQHCSCYGCGVLLHADSTKFASAPPSVTECHRGHVAYVHKTSYVFKKK